MALEVLLYNDEFLLDSVDDLILYESEASLTCCCGSTDCTALECDCSTTGDTQGTEYSVRKKTGDFKGCDANCFDQVDTAFDAAGGSTAGAGIPMTETGLPGKSCEFQKGNMTVCDCLLIPPQTTPVPITLTINCVDYQGSCQVHGIIEMGGYSWGLTPFDITAGAGNKQVFTLITAAPCCNNAPSELEVWRTAG